MTIFQAIFLGILQGIAEFLPISSSGHLSLFQKILNVEEPSMFFDVMLHVGTLVPIFIIYWDDIYKLIRNPFQKMTYLLLTAMVPTGIIGLLFESKVEELARTGQFLAVGFIITGLLLMYADTVTAGRKKEKDITYVDALVIGTMQGMAVAPAVSRSGSTITGALARKLDRETAAKFSFLLSIPAILAAALLNIIKIIMKPELRENIEVVPTIAGFIAAAVAGFMAIKLLLAVIKKAKLKYFAYYVFALAGLILIDQFITHIYF